MTRRLGAIVVILGLLATFAATPVLAASIVVNSLADSAADDGACTLREAITAANTDTASGATAGECGAGSGVDVITFSVSGPIALTDDMVDITSDLTIDGSGAVTVDGIDSHRPFAITGGTVTLANLTITRGLAPDLFLSLVGGGGIWNGGSLTVVNSTLSANTATGSFGGGGIINEGVLTLLSSTLSGNSADSFGGGILNVGPHGIATISNSTMSGNAAFSGGGIANGGTISISNSTVSGNAATTASGGGGIIFAAGTATMANSIVAGNTAAGGADDVAGAFTATTNMVGDPAGILDPAGLADNGGPTQTIALALVAGNPAIDTATAATCAAAPVSGLDQRGLPRPAACDIGAYEAQPPSVAAHADVSAAATSAAGAAVSYSLPAGTDEQGGAATVACLPASGSTFAVGSTTVTCTATDAVGHTATGTFQVIVGALAATPTPMPRLLPNTATAGNAAASGLQLVLATLGLVSIGLVARATRAGRRRD